MEKIFNSAAFEYPQPQTRGICPKVEEGTGAFITLKDRNVYRQGNHIYFYDSIDEETQMWLMQAMNAAYEEAVVENAKQIARRRGLDENIYLHINSPGGGVLSSLALYDFIKNFQMCCVGIVEGQAASGASILLCACQLREMTENSTVLVHELRRWNYSYKKMSQIEDDFENDKFLMGKLKSIYLKETTIPEQEIKNILSHDIYWDVDICKKYELCDMTVGQELTEEQAKAVDEKVYERLGRIVPKTKKKQTKPKPEKSEDLKKSDPD